MTYVFRDFLTQDKINTQMYDNWDEFYPVRFNFLDREPFLYIFQLSSFALTYTTALNFYAV